jgi:hypothetical protein
VLRLRERDLATERLGEDLGQIGPLARHDRPIGQRHTDSGQLRFPLWRLDVGGAKVEEVAPFARILRTRHLSRRRLDHGELPIANEAAPRRLGSVHLLPHHRLHRVAPERDNRTSPDVAGRRLRRILLHEGQHPRRRAKHSF